MDGLVGSPEELGGRGHKQPPDSHLLPASRLLWRFPDASLVPVAEALEAWPQQDGGDSPEVPRLLWPGIRRDKEGQAGPAGARPLAAAGEEQWEVAALAISPGPQSCPGHCAVWPRLP